MGRAAVCERASDVRSRLRPPRPARRFLHKVYHQALSCTREYYLDWLAGGRAGPPRSPRYRPTGAPPPSHRRRYERFKRGFNGTLAPPLWTGPPVPRTNRTHDALVVEPYRNNSMKAWDW